MFLSYEYIKSLGYDDKTKQSSYQCKIIDSDFEEVGVGVVVGVGIGIGVGVEIAVIDTYEKRNLNVAKNLMLAMLWDHKKYQYNSVQQIIEANRKYNPKFAKYEKELDKYMVLI